MKSATSVIALVAAIAPFALAVPFNFERDDVKYEYVTRATTVQAWVTVTPGAENVKAAEVTTSTHESEVAPFSTSSHDHTHKEGGWSHSHAASTTATPSPPATTPSAFTASALPTSEVSVPTTAPAPTTEAAKAPAPAPAPTSSPDTTSSAAPATVSAASAASGSGEAWQNADVSNFDPNVPNDGGDRHLGWLRAHNEMRSIFQAAPLVWDTDLENAAKSWYHQADQSVACVMQHHGSGYGQNIAGGYNSPHDAVGGWVNEYKDFPFNDYSSANMSKVGHFTQVAWLAATKLGCAQHNCGNGWLTMCNYNLGNDMSSGLLEKNVKQNTGPVP